MRWVVVLWIAVMAAQAPQTPHETPAADAATVERGHQLLTRECGFCHGANARGGSSGPDLTRSTVVLEDDRGAQLETFLRVGRPERGMPKFDQLTSDQIRDLAIFLHDSVRASVNRGEYKILDILVGDRAAGETFFNGAGRCATCHSTTGDLRAIGAKYEPAALQGRIVMPRSRATAVKATVTVGSESFTGTLVRLTDFDVVVSDPVSGDTRSWLRNGDSPKVVVKDPIQAHVDMLMKWTDDDLHNVTAFLAGVK
ncbi:MAG TPA: cytochrome c [Vicinamibacterales bacterium]|nr:cytochrome c [Vicinamibacterales bacterium]